MSRPRQTATSILALTALLAVTASGCSGGRRPWSEGQGGIGLPALAADERVDGVSADFDGVLVVAPDGCIAVRVTTEEGRTADRWAVWPRGAEHVASDGGRAGARVGDQTILDGDRISGTGRQVDLTALPGGQDPGTRLEGAGRYCDAPSLGVLVIDEVRRAADFPA